MIRHPNGSKKALNVPSRHLLPETSNPLFLNIPNLPLLTFFGQNSLIIMCTHLNFYVMYFAIRITDAIAACFGNVSRPVWVVCMLVLTMFLEIPVILLVRICFPFVLGRARAQWRVSAKTIQKK